MLDKTSQQNATDQQHEQAKLTDAVQRTILAIVASKGRTG